MQGKQTYYNIAPSFSFGGLISFLTIFRALQEADVILLLGARLNWILHFGLPPRFNPKVKVIQVIG